jgi:hypothetical protein
MFARPYMLPKTASWECVSVKGHQRGEGRRGRRNARTGRDGEEKGKWGTGRGAEQKNERR